MELEARSSTFSTTTPDRHRPPHPRPPPHLYWFLLTLLPHPPALAPGAGVSAEAPASELSVHAEGGFSRTVGTGWRCLQ